MDSASRVVKEAEIAIDGVVQNANVFNADPGEHRIDVSADGYVATLRKLTLREGEKKHESFLLHVKNPEPATTTSVARHDDAGPSVSRSPIPLSSWISFGAGAVGLAAGAVLTGVALHEKAKCTATECVGTTPEDNESALRTETLGLIMGYAIAAIGGGLGVAFLIRDDRTDGSLVKHPTTARLAPLISLRCSGVRILF